MLTGDEWIIDAYGCRAEPLACMASIRRVCDRVIRRLKLHVVGEPQWHRFPDPGGVTGLYLLSESHLACHTWPETGVATFNLFCCRPRDRFPWRRCLKHLLGAEQVQIRHVVRGTPMPDPKRYKSQSGARSSTVEETA